MLLLKLKMLLVPPLIIAPDSLAMSVDKGDNSIVVF